MNSWALRPATPADRTWLWKLKRRTMRTYVEQSFGVWDDAIQHANFIANFAPASLQIIVVAGRDAGYLHCERARHEIFLANIALEPRLQNQGIGTAVLHELQAQAAAAKLPLRLQVLKTNPAARRLYTRLGFTLLDESATHIRMLWRPE